MIHTQNKSSVLKNTFVDYQGSWTKSTWATGSGFLIEGKVVSKRRHTIKTGNDADLPTRLVAIQIEVIGDIMRREFDPTTGEELAPQISQNERHMKGYLHTFNKTDAKALNTQSVEAIQGYMVKMAGVGLVSSELVKTIQKGRKTLELWGDQSNFLDLEIAEGDTIRAKTIGDSIVIESMTVVNQTSSKTFASGGNSLGNNWTAQIAMNAPSSSAPEEPRSKEDDAEWD